MEFFEIVPARRPAPRACAVMSSHRPCKACLDSVAAAGFTTVYCVYGDIQCHATHCRGPHSTSSSVDATANSFTDSSDIDSSVPSVLCISDMIDAADPRKKSVSVQASAAAVGTDEQISGISLMQHSQQGNYSESPQPPTAKGLAEMAHRDRLIVLARLRLDRIDKVYQRLQLESDTLR
jgi:hypothetical protein